MYELVKEFVAWLKEHPGVTEVDWLQDNPPELAGQEFIGFYLDGIPISVAIGFTDSPASQQSGFSQ